MKHQIPVWVALAFLMVFMVVFAGFIFTLQTRGQLVGQVATMEAGALAQQEEGAALIVESTAQAVRIADIEATRDRLSAELSSIQANSTDIVLVTPEAASAQAAVAAAPEDDSIPSVSFVTPEDGSSIAPGDEIEILLSITDNAGVDQVTLTVNNDVLGRYSAENALIYTVKEPWIAETTGTFRFVASATNANGLASESVEAVITVNDREAKMRGYIAEIQAEVEEIRGLVASEPISLTLYTSAELRENFEEIFLDELSVEDSRRDVIELYAFDFIDLDYDLYNVLLDLYSSSVLGFYDPETKELVVVSDDDELTPSEQLTLAHEINHALQDQVFGLTFDDEDSEASFALRSLAEGDSTLLQSLYVSNGYFNDEEMAELIDEFNNAEVNDLSNLPDLILRQQSFPYDEGATFVNTLYQIGGFEAVNNAWRNPPVTTEQIIHPETYPDGLPISVTLPPYTNTLGTGWEQISVNTMGEFSLLLYLEQQVDSENSTIATTGWGGDQYAVYWNEAEQQVVMVMLSEWDGINDDLEFSRSYVEYLGNKYGVGYQSEVDGSRCWTGEDVTCLYQINESVLIIRAPDRDTVLALRAVTSVR